MDRWRPTLLLTAALVAVAGATLVAAAAAAPARAATLEASVWNTGGDAVADAVVTATRLDAATEAVAPPAPVVIDQVDKEFVPFVTAVPVGTRISFPNRDQIRHHVYSFSEAKTFEIPLYKGSPPDPILFDASGEVALGCNIHDWMRAYVFVSETPWFAVTDEGGDATLELPPGTYRLEVWHPELDGESADHARELRVGEDEPAEVRFRIAQKRSWRPRRAPVLGDPFYR